MQKEWRLLVVLFALGILVPFDYWSRLSRRIGRSQSVLSDHSINASLPEDTGNEEGAEAEETTDEDFLDWIANETGYEIDHNQKYNQSDEEGPAPESDATLPKHPGVLFGPNHTFTHYNGYPEDWKLAMRNAGWTQYPFSDEDMRRTYKPRNISNCGFKGIVERLNAGEHIRLGVYGGSVTYGHVCQSRIWGKDQTCAWPNRVAAWLRLHYPTWNITVVNLARPAYGPEQFLSFPVLDVADAYILDTNVNEGADYHFKVQMITRLSGPKLFVGTHKSCTVNLKFCLLSCLGKKEDIIAIPMRGRKRLKGEALLPKNRDDPTYVCNAFWKTQDYQDIAAEMFGISHASYRDAYWPVLEKPNNDIPFFWNGLAHPDTVGHDFISHVVEYALFQIFNFAFNSPAVPSCQIRAEYVPVCSIPSTYYDAENPSSLQPQIMIGWDLFEDRVGKPGWISTSVVESQITFEVNLSKALEVTFLASYKGVFTAYMRVDGCEEELALDPIWLEPVSMPRTLKYARHTIPDYIALPCIAEKPLLNITFRAPEGKFKLLRIMTC